MIKSKDLPPVLKIKACLKYNSLTGVFTWRERPLSHFETRFAWAMWNDKYAYKVAGMKSKIGYIIIKIDGKAYKAHRIAWKIVNFKDPVGVIDHINGFTDDNRIENLRDVSFDENMRNRKKSKANNSGYQGVHYCKSTSKWVAQISDSGAKVMLGCFDNAVEANIARKEAEKRLGFHENHGR